jgi:PAS domain S-box-containing protein
MNAGSSTLSPAQIAESDTRLELVAAAAGLGLWDWDLTTDHMEYSDRAKAIFGFPLDEPVTLEQLRDATHPDDLQSNIVLARRSLDPEIRDRRPYEHRIIRPDGSVRWVLAHGQAVLETVGGVTRATRYIGTIQDITARKEMEEALRASESRLRLALDAGRMAVWEYDIARNALILSPELKRLLGFREDENPTLEDVSARYYPGERERLQEAGHTAVERGERFFEVEFRYTRPDGVLRSFLLRAEIILDPQGLPQTAIGVLLDITERKRHEEHLEVLMRELSHRSKNLLAVVQAMMRLTARSTPTPREFEKHVTGRIQALARTHDVLVQQDWRGAYLETVIRSQLEAFPEIDPSRIVLAGPNVLLANNAAQDLGVAIYELLTNACRYGALSDPAGRISIAWELVRDEKDAKSLCLTWTEEGGPKVELPQRRGFGRLMLERAPRSQADAPAVLEFSPEGVKWRIRWAPSEFSLCEPKADAMSVM